MRSIRPFHRFRRALAASNLFVAACLVPGCFNVGDDDDDSSDDSCETDDDCRNNYFCNSDDECERKDTDPAPECVRKSDCKSGEFCNSSGECQREAVTKDPCSTLCQFFDACSTDPPDNCLSSCSTVLGAPPPCGTDFELYIECVATLNDTCSAIGNCSDEFELFSVSCDAEE
jgi:hypothetical protein